uniref:Uncharacterized protein n=1 Tax=Anguilla anguilla TaxID=7936 RepID=A0A0E9T526_ANGAN
MLFCLFIFICIYLHFLFRSNFFVTFFIICFRAEMCKFFLDLKVFSFL